MENSDISWGGSRSGSGRPPKWRSGKCKVVKIPEAIADQVLEVARKIDQGAIDHRQVVEKLSELLEKVDAKEPGYRSNGSGQLIKELRNILDNVDFEHGD